MIIDELQPFFNWLQANPQWAGLLVFLIAFGESIAIIGLIIPGVVIMTAVGALVGADILPFTSTMIWSACGAFLGDYASYGFGYRYKSKIRNMWPFSRYPEWLEKGVRFFHKHGGKSIFIARFVGPVRPIIPLLAGMMQMPQKRFLSVAIIACLLWAPVYLLPGMFLGAITSHLAPGVATEFLIALLLFIILLWVGFLGLRRLYRRSRLLFLRQLGRLWRHPRFAGYANLIRDPQHPHKTQQLLLSITVILGSVIFISWSVSVFQTGNVTGLNDSVYHLMRSLYNPVLGSIMIAITFVGKIYVLAPISLILFAWFLYKKDAWTAWHLAAVMSVCTGIMILFKGLSFNPRPPGLAQFLDGSSYPSAHTSITFALLGFLAIILGQNISKHKRKQLYIGAAIIIGLISLSRLYLGAHWLSDVLAGLLLGFTVCCLITVSYRRHARSYYNIKPILSLTLAAFIVVWSVYMAISYQSASNTYRPAWPKQQLSLQAWWQQMPATHYLIENRFGKNSQPASLQWAEHFNDISMQLAADNWEMATWEQSVQEYLDNIITHIPEQRSPFATRFYDDQAPYASFYKTTPKGILLLHLWQTQTRLSPGDIPLWIGNIHFVPNKAKIHWLSKRHKKTSQQYPALANLKADLHDERWKQITEFTAEGDAVKLLLIRSQ